MTNNELLKNTCAFVYKGITAPVGFTWLYIVCSRVPEQNDHESAETTTQLCLKLFHAIGAEGVTKNDIDIAHRVNSRRSDSHYPSPIVCKFIRRLAKEEVMAYRNETSTLNSDDLDLSADFHAENIGIHEHLIPRLQVTS